MSAPAEAELLIAIKRAPDDDAPRRRYAELLSRANHPRGPWMHAMLDAADPRRPAAERDAAMGRAREGFHPALKHTDHRARSDLAGGCANKKLETYGEPQNRAYEITARWCSWLQGPSDPFYRLHYERGMLAGIEIVAGTEREVSGVVAVLARAAVLRFGVPSRLLGAYVSRRALDDIRELRVTGPNTPTLLEPLRGLPSLRRVDLSDADVAEASDVDAIVATLAHVVVDRPSTLVRT